MNYVREGTLCMPDEGGVQQQQIRCLINCYGERERKRGKEEGTLKSKVEKNFATDPAYGLALSAAWV
jgi:hypothetical protein